MSIQKNSLSPAQLALLDQMQRINFGRIERLTVRDGVPAFDSAPRIIRDIKFGGDNLPRAERQLSDFTLKDTVVDLFRQLAAMGNGLILSLEIRHGLPVRMEVEESPAE